MRVAPQSRQRVMRLSIQSGSRPRLRKPGDELVVGFLLLVGERDRNAHAAPGFDALHKAHNFHGTVQLQTCRKTRANPERIDGFDEHTIGTDIASACSEHRCAPFDVEDGATLVALRTAAYAPSRRLVCA